MSTTYTPVTCAPVEVTTAARAAGLRPGFGVVMAADAHDRARALTERSDLEEGVAVVMGALSATLEALIGNRALPLRERLVSFYVDYSGEVLSYRRVRLMMFSGLKGFGPGARAIANIRLTLHHLRSRTALTGLSLPVSSPRARTRSISSGGCAPRGSRSASCPACRS